MRSLVRLVVAIAVVLAPASAATLTPSAAAAPPWESAAVPPTEATSSPTASVAGWGPVLEAGSGHAAANWEPTMTIGGDAFVQWRSQGRVVYVWKPIGAGWTSPARGLRRAAVGGGWYGSIATGKHRVTAVWVEPAGPDQVQYFTRWFDADGSRGRVKLAGPPQPDDHGEKHLAASTGGVLAVLSSYNRIITALVRASDGTWLEPPAFPVAQMNVAGIGVDPSANVTVVGFDRTGAPNQPIIAVQSAAGGLWSTTTVGPRPGRDASGGGPNVPMVVEAGRAGDLVVLWYERDGAGALVAAHGSGDGAGSTTWAVDPLEEPWACAFWVCARGGVDAAGHASVLWVSRSSNGSPTHVDVKVARRDAAAGWGPTQTLLTDVGNRFDDVPITDSFIDVAPAGDVLVTYPVGRSPRTGRFTYRCQPGAANPCSFFDVFIGPQTVHESFYPGAGPDGTAVGTWTPFCWDGCEPNVILSRAIEPAA